MNRNQGGPTTGGSSELPRWRVGMQVRGGRITHTMAQVGTTVFVGFGALSTLVAAILSHFFSHGAGMGLNLGETILAGMLILAPIGAGVFAAVGYAAQTGAQAWLASAPPIVSAAEQRAQALADRLDQADLRSGSRWEHHYARCLRSVFAFHAIVPELPVDAVKGWFAEVGRTLDAELAEALRLATLGNQLEEGSNPETGLNPAGVRADEQLEAAAVAFEETTARTGEIALNLRDESDFAGVRAQLDMLVEQTPQLRAAGAR